MSTRDLINAMIDDDASLIQTEFQNAIAQHVMNAISQRRIEVASTMLQGTADTDDDSE